MRTFIFCLFLGFSGLCIPIVYKIVTESSVLSIQSIQIKTGQRAKAEELLLYLRDFVGQPLYGVDLKAVQKEASKHPWVASVQIRRQPPHELEVQVVEREPMALIKQGQLKVVDSSGTVFKTAENEFELSLPWIEQLQSIGILKTHQQTKQPGGKIVEVRIHGPSQSRVLFSSGLEVIIGNKDSLVQWEKMVDILNSMGDKKELLVYIYLDGSLKSNQASIRLKKGS